MLKQKGVEITRAHILSLVGISLLIGMFVMSFTDSSADVNTEVVATQDCKATKLTFLTTVQDVVDSVTSTPPAPIVFTGEGFPTDMTTVEQAELLIYAYNIALNDGHKDPTVLQGLIWQESHAGGYAGHEVAGDEYGLRVGKRYYGVGQIKVDAAKDVFKRFPDEFPNFYEKPKKVVLASGKTKWVPGRYLMTDEEIIAYLITDKKFNIRVASKYLWIMQHREKNGKITLVRPVNYAITAYNRGLGNTYKTDYDNWHYTVSINGYRTTWIPLFNEANKTHLETSVEEQTPETPDNEEEGNPTTTADATAKLK